MEKLECSVDISATRDRVWDVLWDDKTFRDWASNIDEGTYMQGELKEGNEVQFISSVSGYGVTSLVEKLTPNEFILFRQILDTKDSGEAEREKEWGGSTESYSLRDNNGKTTLKVTIDLPPNQEETFRISLPIALQRVKALSENGE